MIGNYNKLKLYFESTTPLKGNIVNLLLKQYYLVRELSFASRAGFEITYCDLENTMHFPLFTIVFPTYVENRNTKEGFCFLNQVTKTKFILAVKVNNNFNMMCVLT